MGNQIASKGEVYYSISSSVGILAAGNAIWSDGCGGMERPDLRWENQPVSRTANHLRTLNAEIRKLLLCGFRNASYDCLGFQHYDMKLFRTYFENTTES